MCLDVVAPARHISRDLLLWVGGPTILLNEGIHRGIDRVPFGSPLSPACPPCWEEAAGVGLSIKDHQDMAPKPLGADNLLLAFKSM